VKQEFHHMDVPSAHLITVNHSPTLHTLNCQPFRAHPARVKVSAFQRPLLVEDFNYRPQRRGPRILWTFHSDPEKAKKGRANDEFEARKNQNISTAIAQSRD
jgi:hypothetical protein